jgi:ubiquitin carboxyl-terminal hydrolase 1
MNQPVRRFRTSYDDDPAYYHQDYRDISHTVLKPASITIAIGLLSIAVIYQIFYALDYDLLPLPELIWNALVFMTPSRVINAIDKDWPASASDENISHFRTHQEKRAVMRRFLGFDTGGGIMGSVAHATRRMSSISGIASAVNSESAQPAGLGNWDNSCYQNSVLQGLAALDSLPDYLMDPSQDNDSKPNHERSSMKMAGSLRELITTLNDSTNNGKRIWTPAALKSMSSWQQQDAQEYYSKVLDEVDKEVARTAGAGHVSHGFASKISDLSIISEDQEISSAVQTRLRNPLEGLLAQRVGCTKCGYSEGLSMIPFNCLTVPIGREWYYNVAECLDEYTKLEPIEGVECGKCTLLKNKHLLETLAERSRSSGASETLLQSTEQRLEAVNQALEEDDYEEKTLLNSCKIPAKNRVSTTKSRQAVIARPPKSLAVHVNRSLFDETTGELKKNYAEVRFPRVLDLGPWCLGSYAQDNETEEWLLDPVKSMIASSQRRSRTVGPFYELRAVVTHYGRHENGHYICYRKHPVPQALSDKGADTEQWWRLSDDDVTKVSEENVLGQGGVFMLFYDCVQPASLAKTDVAPAMDTVTDAVSEAATAARVPLPVEDIENEEDPNEPSKSPCEGSIATSASEKDDSTEADAAEDYQPAQAIHIRPYIESHGYKKDLGEQDGQGMRSNTNLVMV